MAAATIRILDMKSLNNNTYERLVPDIYEMQLTVLRYNIEKHYVINGVASYD